MSAPGSGTRHTDLPWWVGRGELVLAAILTLLGVVLVVGNLTMDVVGDGGLLGPQGFGWIVAVLSFGVAAQMTLAALRKPREERMTQAAVEATNWTALLTCLGGVVGFAAFLDLLGWLLASTLLFAAVSTGLGARPVLRNVAIGFILASVLQLLFGGVLGLNLPAGVIGAL